MKYDCFLRLTGIAIIMAAAIAPTRWALAVEPSLMLQDFESANAQKEVRTLDTTVQIVGLADGGHALSVTSGVTNPYPNVRIVPPQGRWDLSRYNQVQLDITNTSAQSIKFGMRVDNPGATGRKNSITGNVAIDPGKTATLSVPLQRPAPDGLDEKLIGMDFTPWGRRGETGGSIDVANVVEVNVFLGQPGRTQTFTIDNLRATGQFDPATLNAPQPFFPFVDAYGQYVHADWPGKVKSDEDLQRELAAEKASIRDFARPGDWDEYGGWASGPALKATGHFTTVQHEGKWYLVDPDGKLFFSVGIDVVRAGGDTPISDRDGWFEEEIWKRPEFEPMLSKSADGILRGDYKDKSPATFSFLDANLRRKYGGDFMRAWREMISQRMLNWGFNTMGCWSDPALFPGSAVPYTHWIHYNAPKLPWRAGVIKRLPDPFNPEFAAIFRRRAQAMTRGTVDDPNCIGYFVDNELMWGDSEALGETALLGDATSFAKVEFVKDLKEKYGDIAKLNASWKAKFQSWDALLNEKIAAVRDIPRGPGTKADFEAFTKKTADSYFSQIKSILKEIAPHKLYLGCRFAQNNPIVVRSAAEHCDVVSFNLYQQTVAAWEPSVEIDKPILIGEFHFGATDRGVFGPGLVRAGNSRERAAMFERYVTGAAGNPRIVGAHWFQLYDQPTSGRTQDGENYNIGFLSITDHPYQEMIEASRAVANKLYKGRAGAK